MDGGIGADNRCEKLHQCSTAGPDPVLKWWSSLTPTEQGAVILIGVLAVAIVSCVIGCEGFAAVPEAAAGVGLDLGLGGLSIGTLGLGTLGIGVLGLDLGIMELGTLLHPSTSDPTGQSRGSSGGSGGGGQGGTASSWTSSLNIGDLRPGEQPRTPGTDPSFGREKFKGTEEPAEEKFPWLAACAVSGLTGVFVGVAAKAATGVSDKDNILAEGGGLVGLIACTAAYLKYG